MFDLFSFVLFLNKWVMGQAITSCLIEKEKKEEAHIPCSRVVIHNPLIFAISKWYHDTPKVKRYG